MSSLLESTNALGSSGLTEPSGEADGSVRRNSEVVERPLRRRFTAAYKQHILEEADSAQGFGAIGRILRREGLYSSHLREWRKARTNSGLAALEPRQRGPKAAPVNPLKAENDELRRDKARLLKKLKTAELMIDLQKKVSEILGITLPEIRDDEENS
jgi:transposase-like protein